MSSAQALTSLATSVLTARRGWRLSVLLLCALMLSAAGMSAPTAVEKRARQLCGKNLVSLATKICHGCIIEPTGRDRVEIGKRATHEEFLSALNRNWLLDADRTGDGPTRAKRGIVEECCYDPCSFSTIKNYCCD